MKLIEKMLDIYSDNEARPREAMTLAAKAMLTDMREWLISRNCSGDILEDLDAYEKENDRLRETLQFIVYEAEEQPHGMVTALEQCRVWASKALEDK